MVARGAFVLFLISVGGCSEGGPESWNSSWAAEALHCGVADFPSRATNPDRVASCMLDAVRSGREFEATVDVQRVVGDSVSAAGRVVGATVGGTYEVFAFARGRWEGPCAQLWVVSGRTSGVVWTECLPSQPPVARNTEGRPTSIGDNVGDAIDLSVPPADVGQVPWSD